MTRSSNLDENAGQQGHMLHNPENSPLQNRKRQERGWSHQQIHLALFEIAIASIKTEKLDIATLVRLRRAAWCATPMD